jgi:hypothetical protein
MRLGGGDVQSQSKKINIKTAKATEKEQAVCTPIRAVSTSVFLVLLSVHYIGVSTCPLRFDRKQKREEFALFQHSLLHRFI